jgi:DNA-3-methyladenine glycosylase II
VARTSLSAAVAEVAARDPVAAELVALAGPLRHIPRDPDGPFGALVRAIVFQQLPGDLTPDALAAVPDDVLRGAGLSGAKLASLRDLTSKVGDGVVVLTGTGRLSDAEIVTRLTTVRGIGRWTAEMFLMFELRRLDVWPVDDLGVRRGYGLAWRLPTIPTAKELEPLGERFRPYRSVVARYCWEAAATIVPAAPDPVSRRRA